MQIPHIDQQNCQEFWQLRKIQKIKESKTIIITGGVGTGKTFLAKYIFKPEYFIDELDFKQHIVSGTAKRVPAEEWQSWKMYPLECLCRYNTVVYDDYGACEASTAYLEKTLYWINERKKRQEFANNRRNGDHYTLIVTTNLNGKEIKERDARIYSRLLENAYIINLKGDDRRSKRKILLV